MPRRKERRKFIHQPSTQEIFRCLSGMPSWSQILLEHGEDKLYKPFLKWLLAVNYINKREEKLTMKKLAATAGYDTARVTKWLHEIYEDILELNFDKPALFTKGKLPVHFYISWYDSYASVNIGLDVVPREYEHFRFPFIHARIGLETFWVCRVEHEVCDHCVQTIVWLDGGSLNKYREMAVEEGLFKGWLGFWDKRDKTSLEIDEILLNRLKR